MRCAPHLDHTRHDDEPHAEHERQHQQRAAIASTQASERGESRHHDAHGDRGCRNAPAKTSTTIRDRDANASRPAAVGGASGAWSATSSVSPRRARATTIQSREMISGGSSPRYTTPNGPTVPTCRTGRGDAGTGRGRPKVEVPGIEPGSFVVLPGLLRAQPALPLLGSGDHAGEFTVTSPVALVSLPVPRPYRKVEPPS